jgi:signal transduction histidine kinase
MPNRFHFLANPPSSQSLVAENKPVAICGLLQAIDLPAVQIAGGTAEVLDLNELFSSLIDTSALSDHRLWFVEGVARQFTAAERERWETAFSSRKSIQVRVRLRPPGRQATESIMWASPLQTGSAKESTVCVFLRSAETSPNSLGQTWIAEGQELERSRIRAGLHQDVAQRFLAAAFGCMSIAEKIARFDENLGKEASNLAELLSKATQELHRVVNPPSGGDS